jgi:hypothetical protein
MFGRRRKWVRTTGRVLDLRVRTVYHPRGENSRGGSVPLHSYVVEFQAPNGEKTRLEVEQPLAAVRSYIGDDVPLLVKPDGTEAVLDDKDPRVNVMAVAEANRQADEERFRSRIEG